MAAQERTKMDVQDPKVRAHNFKEVALGYSAEQAQAEAARCLNCKAQFCKKGCPVSVPIPEFIASIKEGDFEGAYEKISAVNSLSAVCGRVCPQEEQCEHECVLARAGKPIAIGNLERFAADYAREHEVRAVDKASPNGIKVAVIGSGPSGLTCAGDLNRLGYDVTVFEAFHKCGGVLVYGIPEFRLPKDIVQHEVGALEKAGVHFECNVLAGRTVTVQELMRDEGFKAVFIGSGAGLPRFMNIPGENLIGVYSANEFLTRINLMKAYDKDSITPIFCRGRVMVVGGGNVAMDAARSALRMGADEVHIVYRRSMEELPARREEVHHAIEEGIIFDILTNPTEVLGENGKVNGIKCVKMELTEPDASGRRAVRVIEGSEFEQKADVVIMSIGTSPNPLLRTSTPDLKCQKWGGIIADEDTGATSIPGVYAGGDAVTGAATVILAMGAGKKAAAAIDKYIRETN